MAVSAEKAMTSTDRIIKSSDQQLERYSAEAEEFETLTQEGFLESTLLLLQQNAM